MKINFKVSQSTSKFLKVSFDKKRNWYFNGEVDHFDKFKKIIKNIDNLLNCDAINCEEIQKLSLELQMKSTGNFFIIGSSNEIVDFYCVDLFANVRMYINLIGPNHHLMDNPVGDVESGDNLLYFKNKGYSPCHGSIFKNSTKVAPGEFYFKNKRLNNYAGQSDSFFKTQRSKRFDLVDDMEASIIRYVNEQKGDVIVAFSGGLDSLWIISVLIKHGIDFKSYFIKRIPSDYDNREDLKLSLEVSRIFDFNLSIFDCDLNSCLNDENLMCNLAKRLSEDKGLSADIFLFSEYLAQKYGRDTVVITGQTSDSLFSWGLTSISISSLIQRFMLSGWFLEFISVRKFFSWLKIGFSGERFVPVDINSIRGLLYMPDVYVLRGSNSEQVLAKRTLDSFLKHIDFIDTQTKEIRTLSKVNYLTGPSNIPWFRAASYADIKCFMPFLNPNLLHYLTSKYYSFLDILIPRYILWFSVVRNLGVYRTIKYFFTRYGPFKIKIDNKISATAFNKINKEILDRRFSNL